MSSPEVITLDDDSDVESNSIVLGDSSSEDESNSDDDRLDEKFVCHVCDANFEHMIDYQNHKNNHPTLAFQCSLCQRRAKSAENRNKHEVLAHKLSRPKEHRKTARKLSPEILLVIERKRGPFKTKWNCETCNYGFASKYEFDQHQRHKHIIRTFQCSLCTKKLPTFTLRNHHEKKKHRYFRPIKFWKATCKVPIEKRRNKTVSHTEKHRKPSKERLRVSQPSASQQENSSTPDASVQEPVRVTSEPPTTSPENDNADQTPTIDSSATQIESTAQQLNPFIDTVDLAKELSKNPIVIYYDYEMCRTQFGQFPITHWRQQPDCKVLLIRFAGPRGEKGVNLSTPIWTIPLPRYEKPPETSRSSYLSCIVKDCSSSNLVNIGKQKMNMHMNFQNLLTEYLPALQLERTLVIASNHDRHWSRTISYQSNRISIL